MSCSLKRVVGTRQASFLSLVCSNASLRDDKQMARQPSHNVQSRRTALKPIRGTNLDTICSSRTELLCAGTVFLVALLLYTLTLAPTVTLVDSGELILAAHGLGVAHPPGFPLWVMLAHLASLLPVGNVAARINFSSAFFAALACAMLSLVVAELTITGAPAASPKGKRSAQQSKSVHASNRDRFLQF